jgi:hypothetical protein
MKIIRVVNICLGRGDLLKFANIVRGIAKHLIVSCKKGIATGKHGEEVNSHLLEHETSRPTTVRLAPTYEPAHVMISSKM